MSKIVDLAVKKYPRFAERRVGFIDGYEQAIEDAIAYLKVNAEKYIVDCTSTYPDAPQDLKIGGMLYEHLRQSLTDD